MYGNVTPFIMYEVYIYRLFFTVGYYSVLNRVPSATQYVFVFFFLNFVYSCVYMSCFLKSGIPRLEASSDYVLGIGRI